MKRKSLSLFAVLVVFLFTSCAGFLNNSSSVSVRLPGGSNSRELLPDESEKFYFTIICEKSDKSVSVEKDGVSGDVIVFEDLTPGKYIVSGKAYEDEDRTSLSHEGTVTVVAGKDTPATLSMGRITERLVCDGEYSFICPNNFMNNIQIKKYLGSQLEATYTLSTLPSEYSIWVDDLEISNDGSYNDSGTAGKVYENLLGNVPFSIKTSDAGAGDEALLSFSVYIELDSIEIGANIDGVECDLADAPITWENIFVNAYYPVYGYTYNVPDGGSIHTTLSILDGAVRIDRVYNSSGENIGGVDLADDSNWAWEVTVGTTKNYEVCELSGLNSSDFTYNEHEITIIGLTCTLTNTIVPIRHNSKSRTRSLERVPETVTFSLYNSGATYYYYTNYLDSIQVDKTVGTELPVLTNLKEIAEDPDYNVYFAGEKIVDPDAFTSSSLELYKRYIGTIPVFIKNAVTSELISNFTITIAMEDFVIASTTYNAGEELNSDPISETAMTDIVFQPYYRYTDQGGNFVYVNIEEEQMQVIKSSDGGATYTSLISLWDDEYWTWQIGVDGWEDLATPSGMSTPVDNKYKLDSSVLIQPSGAGGQWVPIYTALIEAAKSDSLGTEKYKIYLKYVLTCYDLDIYGEQLNYTLELEH